MDESLKARLIGAAVLVALAVLVIPELLSGRKPAEPVAAADDGRGTRTFTIELQGGATPQTGPGPAVEAPAPATRDEPEPPAIDAPASAAGAPPAAKPADREPAPAPATVDEPPAAAAPVPAAPPDAANARGAWAVQVGAFGTPEAARRLVRELEGAGYRAFVAPTERAGKTLHRVRVGPEAERADAARLAERLKARGLPATVVAND